MHQNYQQLPQFLELPVNAALDSIYASFDKITMYVASQLPELPRL